MSRARKFGALSAVLACAGFVAGCGGGGYTAAESSPTAGGATPTSPAPATPGPATALGAYAPVNAADAVETFKGYQQFPKDRAGKIFVDPTVKPVAPSAPVTAALVAPVTAVPLAPVSPTTKSNATAPTPVAKAFVASLDVSGAVQSAKVGDPVPAGAPQFTVQTISDVKVTLKLNSGTLPGGGTTIDIGVGESVTLSNPTTGASYVVKVTEIKAQA